MNRFFRNANQPVKCLSAGRGNLTPRCPMTIFTRRCRNQWVFNSIQSYLAHPVTLTSSSLGLQPDVSVHG